MEEKTEAEIISPPRGGDSPETSSIPSGSGRQPPVSAESSSGEKQSMRDITLLLSLACKDLGNGELIHGEDFNHWVAIAAVLGACHSTFPWLISANYNIEESITGGAAPVPLSSDKTEDALCVIDVMDHILACEATWHVRATSLTTLGSCFYMWKPEILLSHPLLDSFFRVVQITCDAIDPLITSSSKPGDIHNSYYRSLDTSEAKESLALLEAAEDNLWSQQMQKNPDLEKGLCQALNCRLRFRKHLFSILSCMRKPQGEGLSLAEKHIGLCLSELKSMIKSELFLKSKSSCRVSDVGVEPITTASGFQPVGFGSPVNCTLLSPTSINYRFGALTRPRAVKLLSWTEAVGYFEKLLNDLRIICLNPQSPVLEDAVRSVTDFHRRQPGLVARSHIQGLLVQDGKLYGRTPIFGIICEAAHLPESVKYHAIKTNKTVEQLGELLINLLRTLAGSILLQRRRLGKIVQYWYLRLQELASAFKAEYGDLTSIPVDELASSVRAAEYGDPTGIATDEKVSNVCIYKHILAWTSDQKHWIALRFLLLGFDLELYSPSECCMVYWYIFCIMSNLAEDIKLQGNGSFTGAQHHAGTSNGASNQNSAKAARSRRKEILRTKRTNPPGASFSVKTHDNVPPEVMLLYYLAEGLFLMLGVLRKEHGVFPSKGPFNSEEERFIQHFKKLQDVGYFSYSAFKEWMDWATPAVLEESQSFTKAQKIVSELKKKYVKDEKRVEELNLIEQVAICNRTASQLLLIPQTSRPIIGSLSFSNHPHFATVCLEFAP